MKRIIRSLTAATLLALSSSIFAHVTVWPKESARGAHQKYEVRVPNEKKVDTIAIEVRFPPSLRVTSTEQKPGWTTEAIRDTAGGTVGVRWTGKLPPREFAEFGLIAVNPTAPGDLCWTAVQFYGDGTTVDWSGPSGSKTPAPHVTIK